ncbi:MAG: NADH dehydrogenase [uncultured Acidimicrobiales bacterium]|uniref:NADH:ubiquinone reductase (non-electrogenic) n=1 Tax=uncultured Acidimicrobiales bacterium TaxID=310071 RepID=A0A6J4IUF4_9ACTN|nr:MAG: NADH dehydrogenase [uncultured Acidimicrobiales bacterium]
MDRRKVVIVGAGFAGLDCAKRLVGEPVDVTIVDRRSFHTFQPLLYQVATAGLSASDVAYPVRGIFQRAPNVAVRLASVTGVDLEHRLVRLAEGPPLPYDHLVLAAGAAVRWFEVPGAEEHGFPLYDLADAIRLRNHVLSQFEAADADPTLVEAGALTFVVVGGGPTGVETAGALTELFAMVLAKDFPRLDVARARVVLLEMGDSVLAPFSHRARRHGHDELVARGVELRLGERVTAVAPGEVTLASGEVIPACTLVWAAGVRASPLADVAGLPQAAGGRIVVGGDLRVPDHPEVFVVGDMAAVPGSGGRLLPQLAPVAKQSGRHAGATIACEAQGRRGGRRFRYRDRGTMATIGRGAAVADLPLGVNLTGVPAWLAWLFLHLLLLAGFRNRLSVFVSWAWNYVTYDRGPRLIIEAPGAPGPEGERGPEST